MLKKHLPELQAKYDPDIVLANAENTSHGRGLTIDHYKELLDMGIDALTSGDHIWHVKDLYPILDKAETKIIRPANYPTSPGKGWLDVTVKGKRIRVVNLIGRVFISPNVDSPFKSFDEAFQAQPEPDAVIVDFHAEATSEKRAMAEYIDGRAQLMVGTHTHVPTADAQILPNGTAFISDLGMVGPQDSCLGADKKEVLKSFLTGLPWRYNVGEGEAELGAIFCEIDLDARRAVKIEHIRITGA